jgi:hypothetical protein
MIRVQLLIHRYFNMSQQESILDEKLDEKNLQVYDHNSDYTLYSGIPSEIRKSLSKLLEIPHIPLTSPP